ncbi:uncharacterized protein LOC135487023 isoform X2 [Lineus longissimus]
MTTQANKFLTMAVDFKEENGKEYAEIKMPGFSFTDFDRTGKLGLQSLMESCEGFCTAKAAVLKCPDPWRVAQEGLLWFEMNWNCRFEERFFQLHRKEVMAPLIIKSYNGKIGRTSFIMINDVFDVDRGSKIMTSNNWFCMVDKDSYQPKELPDWFREAIQKHQTDCSQERFSPQEPPSGAFLYQRNVAPWNLQKIFAGVRKVALDMINPNTNEPFLQISKFWKEHFVFYVSCSIDWERDFYTKGNLLSNLRQVILPGYVGTSSYNSLNKMYHQSSGKLLASSVSQLVLVSRQTRKPVALPEWWRELYKGMMPEVDSLQIKILETPGHTICYPLRVSWSDADGYRHTNMSVYIRFCMDAAATASLGGKYKNFSGDIANIPMKRIVSVYKGESRPGDDLIVKSWEQDGRDDTIHFQIFQGDQLLFQTTALYFRDMPLIKPGIDDGMEHEPKVNPIYPKDHFHSKY